MEYIYKIYYESDCVEQMQFCCLQSLFSNLSIKLNQDLLSKKVFAVNRETKKDFINFVNIIWLNSDRSKELLIYQLKPSS